MSKALVSRIEALERIVKAQHPDPVAVVWDMTFGEPLTGYQWGGGLSGTPEQSVTRKPAETDQALLNRAVTESGRSLVLLRAISA